MLALARDTGSAGSFNFQISRLLQMMVVSHEIRGLLGLRREWSKCEQNEDCDVDYAHVATQLHLTGTKNNLFTTGASRQSTALLFVAMPLQPVATQEGRLRHCEQ